MSMDETELRFRITALDKNNTKVDSLSFIASDPQDIFEKQDDIADFCVRTLEEHQEGVYGS